jgi:restriction system protein
MIAMARSFLSNVVRISREMERAKRARLRETERQQRAMEKEARRRDRSERESYAASREAEAQSENKVLASQIQALKQLLSSRVGQDPSIDFKSLFRVPDERELNNDETLRLPEKPALSSYLPKLPNIFVRWIPGVSGSHRRKRDKAAAAFGVAQAAYNEILRKRSETFSQLKRKANDQNNAVIEFARHYTAGEPNAVATYFELVLTKSSYPDGFPLERRVVFLSESKQLVIEFELPTLSDIIPTTEKFRYVKKSDEIVGTALSEKVRHAIYSNVIAQAVLRCLYDVLNADKQAVVETVVLNAHVSTIDPATGHNIHPCLVSVRTSRDRFFDLDLRYVEPISCLKELRASVSSQPGELIAVKPILEFNMVDHRFIQEADVLSTLDQRPNLMELSPSEFESLITNLFDRMGLDTKLTQASRDGGVDCVAFDSRPVLGGKVIIQAKRYKNTVGVSAVRDLFGTLHNEGASKGILVTTSGFGKVAYEFANGKPIELITGSNLLYLLKEHAEVEAKIEIPPDWLDPRFDAA